MKYLAPAHTNEYADTPTAKGNQDPQHHRCCGCYRHCDITLIMIATGRMSVSSGLSAFPAILVAVSVKEDVQQIWDAFTGDVAKEDVVYEIFKQVMNIGVTSPGR
jgi:hypothetical protein